MSGINTIFCWLGGVIAPTIPEIVVHQLHNQAGSKIDFWKRTAIQELSQDLVLGRLGGLTFCEWAVKASETSLKAEYLEDALIRSATPRMPVLQVLAELPEAYQFWLISDYPPEWFVRISIGLNIYPFIDANRLIFTAECQLTRLIPDIFYLLVHKVNQDMDACMMVTGISAHSIEAVKHGLSTEIFIDAFRLRRSFVLRKMLPQ